MALAILVSWGCYSPSQAAERKSVSPELPFEQYFAKKRGDRTLLKFNDFSGKISGDRILKLLRSGSLLGDRVLLRNNTAIYFPDGYIVSASIRLERWQERQGLTPEQVRTPSDIEPNPDYALVNDVERNLGKVCAEIPSRRPKETVRLRKTKDGMLSLVKRTSGRYDHIAGQDSEAIIVTSAVDPKFLSGDREIQEIAKRCI